MTDIEAKALALVNEVRTEHGFAVSDSFDRDEYSINEVICRAIEQHEAFRQEVSDALADYFGEHLVAEDGGDTLASFIIPKPKPDPLVEVLAELHGNDYDNFEHYAFCVESALEARGLEIREKGQ
jgi:hypothetical protein